MPIYTYVCNECGEKFDLLIGVTAQQEELKCQKCGSENIKKMMGSFSVSGGSPKSSGSDSSCPTGTCPLG
jgi:putative FmdB family regulatory protein